MTYTIITGQRGDGSWWARFSSFGDPRVHYAIGYGRDEHSAIADAVAEAMFLI
jgi:hypothetical protein